MIVHVTDSQVVGETLATLWSTIQQGPVSMNLIIKNSGVNVMSYRLQEFDGMSWKDLGPSGSDFYNTLSPNEVRMFKVATAYPQMQMVGNASGGAYLEFSVQRYVNRPSGGSIPILSL